MWPSRAMFFFAISAALPSCSDVYLHQPDLETATKAVQTSSNALNAPEFFAAQEAEQKILASQEDKALVDMLVASRDYQLLNVIQPATMTSDRRTTSELLRDFIGDELKASAGVQRISPEIRTRVYSAYQPDEDRRLETNRRQLAGRVRQYSLSGGTRGTSCERVPAQQLIATTDNANSNFIYGQIAAVCASIKKYQDNCSLGFTEGRIADVCARILTAETKPDEARLAALERARAALRKTGERPRPDKLRSRVEALIKKAEGVIGDASVYSADERYAAALEALNSVFALDLPSAIQELTAKAQDEDVGVARVSLLDALRLIDAIDAVSTPRGGVLDEPNALLIGIAKTQHELNMVSLDIEVTKRKELILLQEARSLRSAISMLTRAQETLCGDRVCPMNVSQPILSETLSIFLAACNRGTIPDKVLQFHEIQVDRAAALDRAKLTEADWRALIKPAIDALALYGAGGIKPDVLGPFLASLPVTGAIIGK